jgi:8-oxo-dGTP diphosphatase
VSLAIAAGLLRRGSEVLMVQQAGPGEEPAWTVPAGRVEPGETAVAALVREVHEETGLTVLDPGGVAFVVEVEDRRHPWSGTVWTYDVAAWEGDVDPRDPDGFVLQALWVPLDEAVRQLTGLSWHALTVRALRGDIEPGSRWKRVVDTDGREDVTRLS